MINVERSTLHRIVSLAMLPSVIWQTTEELGFSIETRLVSTIATYYFSSKLSEYCSKTPQEHLVTKEILPSASFFGFIGSMFRPSIIWIPLSTSLWTITYVQQQQQNI